MGELVVQERQDLVDTNHVAMEHLALLLWQNCVAIDLCGKQRIEFGYDILTNFFSSEVKNELVPALTAAVPSMLIQAPGWVFAIQLALDVHHLWFYPDPKFQTQCVDVLDKSVQTIRKFPTIFVPISQRRRGVLSLSKPPVIEDYHLHAASGRNLGKLQHFCVVDVKVHGFPRVQQDRRDSVCPSLRDLVLLVQGMEVWGQQKHSNHLRRFKRVARREVPLERAGIDTGVDARSARLSDLRLHDEIPGVDQGEGPDIPVSLKQLLRCGRDSAERVVLMAAGSTKTLRDKPSLH
eukprot:768555-Hanusia_phi.AAC.5